MTLTIRITPSNMFLKVPFWAEWYSMFLVALYLWF